MKIRNGFVSNSSSSSFVLVTTKENHNSIYDKLTEYEKAVINAITFETKVYGIDSIGYETWDNQGTDNFEYLEINWDGEIPEDNDYYKILDKYEKLLLENNKDMVFRHSVDM